MCCVFTTIDELDKPWGKPCQHLDGKSCGIYHQKRPEPCETFRCLWLEGYGTPEARPDRCGVMFASRGVPTQGYEISVLAIEVRIGALETFPAKPMCDLFSQHFLVFKSVMVEEGKPGEFLIEGPEDRLSQLEKFNDVRSYYMSGR